MQRFSTLLRQSQRSVSFFQPRITALSACSIYRHQSNEAVEKKKAALSAIDNAFLPADKIDMHVYDTVANHPQVKINFMQRRKQLHIPYSDNLYSIYAKILIPFYKFNSETFTYDGLLEKAFNLTILFGSYDTSIAYLKKIINNDVFDRPSQTKHEPILLPSWIQLPITRDWTMSLWQSLASKHLPSANFERIFPLAPEIEKYAKDNIVQLKLAIDKKIKAQFDAKGPYKEHDYKNACINAHKHILSQHTDMQTLQSYTLRCTYKCADNHLSAAVLFYKLRVPEYIFNDYLALTPKDDDVLIPNVSVDGASIEYPQYKIEKLSSFSPEAALLGEFTGCCQSLGKAGAAAVKYGIEKPNSGFYVIRRKKDDTIIAQCWAWRNLRSNNIVFDSIESYEPYRKDPKREMVCALFLQLAKTLVKDFSVPKVLVGTGGNTPSEFGSLAKLYDKFFKQLPYSDAHNQRLIAAQEPKKHTII